MPGKPDKPADSYPDNPWPLAAALSIVAVGAGFAAFGHWRRASLLIGGALLLAAMLRLVLPMTMAGLLVVRRRWIDVAVLALLGAAVLTVTLVVPPSR
ncbi:DUF3017 domain-containing protein [Tessaracoccus lapidicaptus]|uniref:DUF3017 domain-containing protein n=1 Tax=Tessaracoccus lapidicaptus TaxID=1427523 RepID=UPI00334028B8